MRFVHGGFFMGFLVGFSGRFESVKEKGLHRTDASLEVFGGPCRDRTYDKRIKSPLLYQLS